MAGGDDEVLTRSTHYVGRFCPPVLSDDAVNTAMIRQWCTALGDTNPVYLDDGAGAGAGFGGSIAPPTMLQAWTMSRYGVDPEPDSPLQDVYDVLDDAGYTSLVAVQSRQDYLCALSIGDRLESVRHIDAVSPRKSTPIGDGYFVSSTVSYRRQDDVEVGRQRFRTFKFRPGRDAVSSAGTRSNSGTTATQGTDGPTWPALTLAVDRTFVVASAIASHDWYAIHHDPEFARARGLDDIIVNVLTTTGLVGRYVTDNAGTDTVLHSVDVRLGQPIYPGTSLAVTGTVRPCAAPGGGGRVEVAVQLSSDRGTHATATVEFTGGSGLSGLPTDPDAGVV